MSRIRAHTIPAVVAAALVTAAGVAHAETELLAGKRLLLRQSAKGERLVIVSRGRVMAPIPGGADDPTLFGAILDVGNPSSGEWARFSIPAAGWKLNALGTIFRYQGGRRAAGDAWALVVRHEKRLKIRGASVGLSLDEPAQGALAVVLTMGSHRYCLLFDGGAVKRDAPRRFAARNAAAPSSCPAAPQLLPSTTSSTFLPRPSSTTTSTTRTTQPLPASTSTSSSSSSTRVSSTVSTSTTSSTTTSTRAPTTTTSSSSTSTTTSSTTSTSSSTTSTSTSSTTSSTGFTCGGVLFCGGTCPPGSRCVGGLITRCRCEGRAGD